MPERTFEWNRYVYVVVHGKRRLDGVFPNILDQLYLKEIQDLDRNIVENIHFAMQDRWRTNRTNTIGKTVHFQVCLFSGNFTIR